MMTRPIRATALALFCSLAVSSCTAQVEKSGGDAQDAQAKAKAKNAAKKAKVRKQVLAALAKYDIVFDEKKKTLTVPVVVNAPTNDLEFLLIHRIGKTHEALLLTQAKPSIINVGLIMIGLKKGQNASFKKKEPQPTEEQLKAGADPFILVPPSGQQVYMTVTFKTKDGKKITRPVDDLLLDWHANTSVTNHQWIYLGGRMAQMYRGEPPVYMADYEGNLISTCYKYPNNHLFTIEHERARDEMNWSKTADCPPPGTEMELTFHAIKPPIVAAREVRMKREAAERKKAGKGVKTDRPERNPAREGQPPPPKKVPPPKKEEKKGGKI
jgi:hypothetical protein